MRRTGIMYVAMIVGIALAAGELGAIVMAAATVAALYAALWIVVKLMGAVGMQLPQLIDNMSRCRFSLNELSASTSIYNTAYEVHSSISGNLKEPHEVYNEFADMIGVVRPIAYEGWFHNLIVKKILFEYQRKYNTLSQSLFDLQHKINRQETFRRLTPEEAIEFKKFCIEQTI